MGKEYTPEFAIQYTKLTTGILFTWPPSSTASRLVEISFQIGWWISWIISVFLAGPLLATAYQQRSSFMQLTKHLCIAVCLIQVVVKMVIGRYHYRRFQYLIEEMEIFVKNANPHERKVLMSYVNRVAPFHYRFNMVSFCGTLAVILGPLALDLSLPTEAEYPFPMYQHPTYDILFLLESIGAIQCGCTGPFDCQGCLLLWYATIRLDFLAEKIRNVNSAEELKECIRIHQHILWYIDETIRTVRPVVAATVVLATISIACGGIHLVGNEPVDQKVQFVGIDIGYSLELLCVAWAAESLTTACEEVGWALYSSPWIQNSQEFSRIAIFGIQRCQKPPKIAVGGLLSELSMNYYATYMSKTFSFFTTLHVMLTKLEEDL
ncbi:uncharacterized protein LOC107045792 [Diachasma alloeum]|uniref:Odorant receptor n=1 Tax=Diachasma alloeum TaxID=454923 RepID=A0A4E0RTC0_9HYME|nr:uncharacterized protein LOC107045792 [Diachasma alloeum]THK33227.1 odorant receptor 61 [Diachasma alloeum]